MSYLQKIITEKKISFVKRKGKLSLYNKWNKIFRFCSGIAVNCLGHAHPKLVINYKENNQKNFGMFLMLFKFLKEKN